jgi:hypothetical protein
LTPAARGLDPGELEQRRDEVEVHHRRGVAPRRNAYGPAQDQRHAQDRLEPEQVVQLGERCVVCRAQDA